MTDISDYIARLRSFVRKLQPSPASRHGERATFVYKDLATTTHVFLRETLYVAVFNLHIRDHTKTPQPNEKPLEDDNAYPMIQKRRHRCPECQRFTAETEEKLLRHIKKVHRGENPFNCYMCDYSTYNKSLFEEHVRIHQGIKPFKCTFCPYKSASKKNTKKHELIHRPDNPLKCVKCGFIARHSRSLKCHIEKNCTGVKGCDKVKCDECDYVSHDAHIKFHKRSMHSKDSYECTICGEKVKSRRFLRKHEATVHNKTVAASKKFSKAYFKCKICAWDSTNKPKILLHLIHHPKQKVDENNFDISILKKFDIM
ncbi:Zinc finger protein 26 [Eumeta japonica]|uniref:Zinc finger protein 26 n=1 Tax=Eumeta variegata TaxID=151549 RepID=A0A4C1U133_EUMVA|nr:Zinc finger protein 26 [Eumeta japonica]